MEAVARGREKVEARRAALALLGKNLARRAERKCEFCEARESLRPYDTEPESDPELDALMLLCPRCTALMSGSVGDPRTCRFLEGAVWHEVPIVAASARACLGRIDADWARDTLEMFE